MGNSKKIPRLKIWISLWKIVVVVVVVADYIAGKIGLNYDLI